MVMQPWNVTCPDFPLHWKAAGVPTEISVVADIRTAVGDYLRLTAVIDTGCSVPMLIRDNINPALPRTKAHYPIKLGMANGAPMAGGDHGVLVDVVLPVKLRGRHIRLRCTSVWAYYAPIRGSDLLIGLPFMTSLHLNIDTQERESAQI